VESRSAVGVTDRYASGRGDRGQPVVTALPGTARTVARAPSRIVQVGSQRIYERRAVFVGIECVQGLPDVACICCYPLDVDYTERNSLPGGPA